ncbi:uncharacterized protein [Dermacentor albipictus]|uniref:uncharacterized protein isoform X3 n=1 Tax=Dermacentor albipictus TaxID=60249 RepID=UPI0038FC7D29
MFIAQGNNSAVPSALQKIFGKCRAQLKSVECDVRLKHREDIFDRTLETTLAPWFGVADAAGACCQLSAAGFTGCPHLQGQDESRPSELSERLSFRRAAWNYAEVVGAPHIGSGTVEHSLGPRSVFPHREQKWTFKARRTTVLVNKRFSAFLHFALHRKRPPQPRSSS